MVKGVSKQVIVVQSPDPALFEQAIFILKEGRPDVTDDVLLEQAKRLIRDENSGKKRKTIWSGSVCALLGAAVTGAIWLVTAIL